MLPVFTMRSEKIGILGENYVIPSFSLHLVG